MKSIKTEEGITNITGILIILALMIIVAFLILTFGLGLNEGQENKSGVKINGDTLVVVSIGEEQHIVVRDETGVRKATLSEEGDTAQVNKTDSVVAIQENGKEKLITVVE